MPLQPTYFIERPGVETPDIVRDRWFRFRPHLFAVLACINEFRLFHLATNRDDLPEYRAARNEINGYQDADGNWVRPEGQRADKRHDSTVAKYTSWIPGLGDKPINKEKCEKFYEEGMALFEQAKKRSRL